MSETSATPGPIGARVSIRVQLSGGSGYQDLLGYLEADNLVRRKDGSITRFDPTQVVAWRQVPVSAAGLAGAAEIESLEIIAQQNWLAENIYHLGQWRLRSNRGFSLRANSVLPLGGKGFGSPGVDLNQAITQVIEFYRELNQPPIFQTLPSIHQELERSIAALGFTAKVELHFETTTISNLTIPELNNLDLKITDQPTDEWLAHNGDAQIAAELMVRTPSKYLHLYDHSQLVATARVAFTQDWAGISRIRVRAEKQGQGIGKKIILATLCEIKNNGIDQVFLQVESENKSALSLYHSVGFSLHHYLNYFILPA